MEKLACQRHIFYESITVLLVKLLQHLFLKFLFETKHVGSDSCSISRLSCLHWLWGKYVRKKYVEEKKKKRQAFFDSQRQPLWSQQILVLCIFNKKIVSVFYFKYGKCLKVTIGLLLITFVDFFFYFVYFSPERHDIHEIWSQSYKRISY